MFLLLLFTSALASLGNYQKYISCINNDKYEMKGDIAQGISPEECAALCKSLFKGGKGCLSFEYNTKTQECRPQKKFAPNVKCKRPNPDEVLYSLPDPNAPSVNAATTKVKSCAQYGGPVQILPDDTFAKCEILSQSNEVESALKCMNSCEDTQDCTDFYAAPNPNGSTMCAMLKCPDSALDSNWLKTEGKQAGRWYKCKDTEDLCPVVAGGALVPDEQQVSACLDRGQMDGKTHRECEAQCLADPECTTFRWAESFSYCGKMECPPGINPLRPDPKMPAEIRYYKCKDGEVAECANDDMDAARLIKELCDTRGIKKKKCPTTCAAIAAHGSFKNDPLCDRINPVAWFPDACPFTCPNARVKCQRTETQIGRGMTGPGRETQIGRGMTGPGTMTGPGRASTMTDEIAMTEESTTWTFDDVCLYSFAVVGISIVIHRAYRFATAKTPVEFGSTYTTP